MTDESFFGPDYQPPADPDLARLHFQYLLLEAGAQIPDTIPASETGFASPAGPGTLDSA